MIFTILSHIKDSLILFLFGLIFLIPFQILIRHKALKENIPINRLHIISVSFFLYIIILMFGFTGIPSVQVVLKYGVLTSNGLNFQQDQINIIPLRWIGSGVLTYIENIILFMPLGFLLPFTWEKYESIWKTSLFGLFLSFSIEFSQLFNWRVSDIDDLMMNTIGTVFGYLIFKLFCTRYSAFNYRIPGIVYNKKFSIILNQEAYLYVIIAFCTKIFFS